MNEMKYDEKDEMNVYLEMSQLIFCVHTHNTYVINDDSVKKCHQKILSEESQNGN